MLSVIDAREYITTYPAARGSSGGSNVSFSYGLQTQGWSTHLLASAQHDLVVKPPHNLPPPGYRRVRQEHVARRVCLVAVKCRVDHN
jgi:hypothetical protein